MSMNLCAHTKTETIHLWQTSTQITYTILPRVLGWEVKGKQARDALIRYMEWVHFSTNGAWNSKEELDKAEQSVKEHLAYLEPFLTNKTLRVGVT